MMLLDFIQSNSLQMSTQRCFLFNIFLQRKNKNLIPLCPGLTTAECSDQCSKLDAETIEAFNIYTQETPRHFIKPHVNSAQNSGPSPWLMPEYSPKFFQEPVRGNTRSIKSHVDQTRPRNAGLYKTSFRQSILFVF